MDQRRCNRRRRWPRVCGRASLQFRTARELRRTRPCLVKVSIRRLKLPDGRPWTASRVSWGRRRLANRPPFT